ncbi:hypothetical protein [Azospirillum argentinense]|uniref:hypothetical protein n=1 Tax=Azospirillum argentinense TaxID=2970906 RepID=UPI0032DF0F0B
MKFRITSDTGLGMGEFEGATNAEALLALHREVGYGDDVVWLEEGDSYLTFSSAENEQLLGDIGDWHITEITE